MDKNELDKKITDNAKTIFAYCSARTSNHFDAEDLACDIIVEIYKSAINLRDEKAFYGFMWAIASNTYKNWCKSKAKNKSIKLLETLSSQDIINENENDDLYLLRRELTLLTSKYRKAVILYYINNKSCLEISHELSISESMVKYLLFKSRKIIKEGISMERNYGTQSYNPKELSLMFWGNKGNRYYHLCDSKISQNILFACYNNKLTIEEISLEIGVSIPYMEDNLEELYKNDLLLKEGTQYYSNIIIFTEDLINEINIKTKFLHESIANILKETINQREKQVRKIDCCSNMDKQTYLWQSISIVLRNVIENLQQKIKITIPKDKYGTECYVWGVEKYNENSWLSQFGFGISNVVNKDNDCVYFLDFPINGESVHHYFFERQQITNVFLDIAKNNTDYFSDNDKSIVADMVRIGYVLVENGKYIVNAPIFNIKEYENIKNIFSPNCEEIANISQSLMETVTKIIKNHVPVHLKKYAHDLAFLRLFEDVLSAPIYILCNEKYLLPYQCDSMLPTTHIVLNK